MTETTSPLHDWNAADADKGLKKPSLLGRMGLASQKSLTRRALKEAGARPLRAGEHERFRNIAQGLSERLGLGAVDLFVVPNGGPNAFAGRADRPVVAVTCSLLEIFTRTDLEAVVAHCLVRSREAGRRGTRVGYSDDVRAVALTRYPPALVSSLDKAEAYQGRYPTFYFVATAPSHRSVQERIRSLNDL